MISVETALSKVLQTVRMLGEESVPLSEADGAVLAKDIVADIDMPPFDKSSMDGYAVRSADVANAPVQLSVVATIKAGQMPDFVLQPGQAAKIMTGAPIPKEADSVQMVEKTAPVGNNGVEIMESVLPGKNLAKQGEIMQAGTTVASKGTLVSPHVISVMAAVGSATVPIFRPPRVAILVTGDELVPVDEVPGAGQIRNSNGHALYAQVRAAQGLVDRFEAACDDLNELRTKIEAGLQKDVLLISGGVSMGDFDFVEDVLTRLGVQILFSEVNIKPGKPTVFGATESCLVFGLPGNPVSASTIFEVLVRPAIRKMTGHYSLSNPTQSAILAQKLVNGTNRVSFHPALTEFADGKLKTRPIASKGSADIVALSASNSFIILPEEHTYEAGSEVAVMLRSEFWKN